VSYDVETKFESNPWTVKYGITSHKKRRYWNCYCVLFNYWVLHAFEKNDISQ